MGALRLLRREHARLILWLVLLALSACVKVPMNRYGVESLAVDGMHTLNEDALKVCLATSGREHAGLTLGQTDPASCDEPPFERRWSLELTLWSRPFVDWPLFDRGAFARDQERILRWYAARGFHAARIVRVTVEPEPAAQRDTIDPDEPKPGCERLSKKQGCTVQLRILVEEGPPTRIARLEVKGLSGLPHELKKELATELKLGERFDEAVYEREKRRIAAALEAEGFALAEVTGQVRVDAAARKAEVTLQVTPGPVCRFGEVIVNGAPDFLVESIRTMTLIDRGDRFSLEAITSAQRAVFGSGGFLSVSVEPILPKSGNMVDVRVNVAPIRKHRFGIGAGIQAGIVTRGDTWEPISVPQWDVHLVAKYTQQRFLSGPRTLTLEERPAMIVQEPFPGFTTPRFGNELRAQLRQAGVIEPRTFLQVSASYIWGPDPYDTFFRHRVDTGVGLERRFLTQERLLLAIGLKNSVYRVPKGEVTMDGGEPSASSLVTYFYQRTRWDYRDNEARPHQGFMLQTELQEAGVAKLSSWTYLRSTPDARVYIPLPFKITFALRFALGIYKIFKADTKLDDLSEKLGPRDMRLRGGGATSNRGFLPGELGDGPDGGTRRWEGSAELRVPLTTNLGVVGFFDVGDVSKKTQFRWKYPQGSSGFGIRYYTIIGALRLDMAWRIKNLQIFGPDERDPGGQLNEIDFGFAKMAGAIHFTIGESF